MSLFTVIWDIIKDIPTSGVLKEKLNDRDKTIASLEKEIETLKENLLEVQSRNMKLRSENEKSSEPIKISQELPLHEISQKILKGFSLANASTLSDYDLRQLAAIEDATSFDFYFSELEEQKYLEFSHNDLMEGFFYELTQKGRKYLLDNRTLQ